MIDLQGRTIWMIVTAFTLSLVIGLGLLAKSNSQSDAEATDLVTIAQGFQKAYQLQSYIYGTDVLPAAILINAQKVDPQIVQNGNIVTRWSQVITLTGQDENFKADLPEIPYNACTDMMRDANLAHNIVSIGVTGKTQRQPSVDLTPANAATDCGSTGTVEMTVVFTGHP